MLKLGAILCFISGVLLILNIFIKGFDLISLFFAIFAIVGGFLIEKNKKGCSIYFICMGIGGFMFFNILFYYVLVLEIFAFSLLILGGFFINTWWIFYR